MILASDNLNEEYNSHILFQTGRKSVRRSFSAITVGVTRFFSG
jgi:hypothetical protein